MALSVGFLKNGKKASKKKKSKRIEKNKKGGLFKSILMKIGKFVRWVTILLKQNQEVLLRLILEIQRTN